MEVADTTLEFDRTRKLEMYADAGIPEYWIVNLRDGALEVYADPAGQAYRIRRRAGPDAIVQPVSAPGGGAIAVAALLP